ncbi:hypothetical protein AD09_4863 [Escherichia coli 1-176-05_S4_C2]|nr:hypothetical protein AD37_5092 [Escherichia coli 1-110-08_S4_C3]KDA87186.1 hypothetical protein AD09_4863 [Escherichia coli 1-176-05_S4_C2]
MLSFYAAILLLIKKHHYLMYDFWVCRLPVFHLQMPGNIQLPE